MEGRICLGPLELPTKAPPSKKTASCTMFHAACTVHHRRHRRHGSCLEEVAPAHVIAEIKCGTPVENPHPKIWHRAGMNPRHLTLIWRSGSCEKNSRSYVGVAHNESFPPRSPQCQRWLHLSVLGGAKKRAVLVFPSLLAYQCATLRFGEAGRKLHVRPQTRTAVFFARPGS